MMNETSEVYSAGATFDPARYLTKVQGRDYLEVKWRLVWARDVYPDMSITTEMTHYGPDNAVFKATVSWPTATGVVICTGWGQEESGDFGDFLEKAETKAIGRALAAAGFGTQFCEDHEGGVVDAPVGSYGGGRAPAGESALATPRQLKYLHAIGQDLGMTTEDVERRAKDEFGVELTDLNRREVSRLIEILQGQRPPAR